MKKRVFGKTGLYVSPLGFGTAEIGEDGTPADAYELMLNSLLDFGINCIDTAALYGNAEEKIGHSISHRRDEFVIVTKCAYGDERARPDWSHEEVELSIDRSLKKMKTDRVDVLLLHQCTEELLDDDRLIAALQKCKDKGKTRFIGCSADNKGASKAVEMGIFDCIESSMNIIDQDCLETYIPAATAKNMGVIIKRSLANAPWLGLANREPHWLGYVKPYIERFDKMDFTCESVGFDGDWVELALRFSVFQQGVHTAIVGTKNLKHIKQNIEMVNRGPLDNTVEANLRQIWQERKQGDWIAQD